MSRHWRVLLLVCCSNTSAASEPSATPASQAFTDATRDSGVEEALARHYESYPDWWLSGLNLADSTVVIQEGP